MVIRARSILTDKILRSGDANKASIPLDLMYTSWKKAVLSHWFSWDCQQLLFPKTQRRTVCNTRYREQQRSKGERKRHHIPGANLEVLAAVS